MGLQSDTVTGQHLGEAKKGHVPGGSNSQGPPYCTSMSDKISTAYPLSDLIEDTIPWSWVLGCVQSRSVSMGHYHTFYYFKHLYLADAHTDPPQDRSSILGAKYIMNRCQVSIKNVTNESMISHDISSIPGAQTSSL